MYLTNQNFAMNEIDLNDDDVISMDSEWNFIGVNLSRLSQLRTGLERAIGRVAEKWLSEGVECELLRAGTPGWVKGKIHLRFEFIPDDLVPIDDQSTGTAKG